MSAQVFLSCGQSKAIHEEIETANAIKQRLLDEFGLDVFVSVNENLFDGNPSFFEALRKSDYFLFVNFKRKVRIFKRHEECYFSLYTHQELAMARAYGFDETNMLVFHQRGMAKDGILRYMFANGEFNNYSDVVEVVTKGVRDKHWSSSYSRHLVLSSLKPNSHVDDWIDPYSNRQLRHEKITIVQILNRRSDCAAVNSQAHLKRIVEIGNQQQRQRDNIDRNPIKVAGIQAYSQIIGPGEIAGFDLFGYDVERKQLFMHTECDVTTPQGHRKPFIERSGDYILTYEVYAGHFPLLTFDVKVHLGNDVEEGIKVSLLGEYQEISESSSRIVKSISPYPPESPDPMGTGIRNQADPYYSTGCTNVFHFSSKSEEDASI